MKIPKTSPVAILLALTVALGATSCLVAAEAREQAARPNLVLIISDDHAWTDYGFMGHPDVQTPHLDQLAKESLRFDRGYVTTSLCRASLASIVTGRFPARHGITANDVTRGMFVINAKGETELLRVKRETLDKPVRDHFHSLPSFIRMLTENGYLAHQSGKWWEGSYADGGFTHGMTEGERHGDKGLVIGREGMEPIEDFINHALDKEKPFLVWYAPFLPHTPHNPPERLLEKYDDGNRAMDVAKYYAMIEWFDETCGELIGILEEKGVREDTVVIYVADNGWAPKSTTGDFPREQAFKGYAMRSKGSPYENGMRTPILVSWPGTVEPAQMDHFAHSIDIFPTVTALAGLETPQDLLGVNLLDTDAVQNREGIFGSIHSSHNMTVGDPDDTLQYLMCIEGDWKLIKRFRGIDTSHYDILHTWDTAPFRLFNLAEDPGEKYDLAVAHPDIVMRLDKEIQAWRKSQK